MSGVLQCNPLSFRLRTVIQDRGASRSMRPSDSGRPESRNGSDCRTFCRGILRLFSDLGVVIVVLSIALQHTEALARRCSYEQW